VWENASENFTPDWLEGRRAERAFSKNWFGVTLIYSILLSENFRKKWRGLILQMKASFKLFTLFIILLVTFFFSGCGGGGGGSGTINSPTYSDKSLSGSVVLPSNTADNLTKNLLASLVYTGMKIHLVDSNEKDVVQPVDLNNYGQYFFPEVPIGSNYQLVLTTQSGKKLLRKHIDTFFGIMSTIQVDVQSSAIAILVKHSNFTKTEAAVKSNIETSKIVNSINNLLSGNVSFSGTDLYNAVISELGASEIQKIEDSFWVGELSSRAFIFDKNTGEITDFIPSNILELTIPPKIDDIPVLTIGNVAFKDKNLNSVLIPNGVTTINSSAFASNNISNVIIPESVVNIGMSAFYSNQLTSISIPDGVKIIENGAFSNNQITTVVFPSGLTSIGPNAFGNNRISQIQIPDSVTSIGIGAFALNELSSLIIPENISLDRAAFSNNKLVSIKLPKSLKNLSDQLFQDNKLVSVEFPENLISIGAWTFLNNKLNAINLPESLVSIGDRAFGGNQLAKIEIPKNVEAIGEGAFIGNEIGSLVIPDNVKTLGKDSFRSNKLTSLKLSNNLQIISAGSFYGNQLENLQIPQNIKSIGPEAFYNNQLTRIEIHAGVDISENSFDDQSFRTSYSQQGAGTYVKNQEGIWIKE